MTVICRQHGIAIDGADWPIGCPMTSGDPDGVLNEFMDEAYGRFTDHGTDDPASWARYQNCSRCDAMADVQRSDENREVAYGSR